MEITSGFERQPPSKLHGYLTVFGGILIHLFCGNLYLWGNISNYVVTYYHFLGDSGARLSFAVYILTISFTTQSIFTPLGPYLQKRWNPKLVLLLGASIMNLAVLGASYCKSWAMFVFLYAFCFPAGIGIVYWVPIMCGWEWFPERKGLISGLIVAGYGFGAFIFGFVTTAIANPDNIKPHTPDDGTGDPDKLFPKDVGERVPEMFRTCLVYWAIFSVISILTVSRNPDFVRKEKIEQRQKLISD